MAEASRQGDLIRGQYYSEHHGHQKRIIVGYDSDGDPIYRWVDMHTGGSLYGVISSGSSNVYINGQPASRVGDRTTDWDDCCDHEGVTMSGKIKSGSSKVYINRSKASRKGDSVSVHTAGYGDITSGSSNVFIGG